MRTYAQVLGIQNNKEGEDQAQKVEKKKNNKEKKKQNDIKSLEITIKTMSN